MATTKAYELGQLGGSLDVDSANNVTLTGDISAKYSGFDSDFTAKSTSDLSEGSNLYYTNARADARVNLQTGSNLDLSNKSTSDLSEGTNLYYTNARADARIAAATTSDLSEGTNLYYTTSRSDSDFDVRLATKSTSNLSEGSNLYYTNARADARVNLQTGSNLDLSNKSTSDLSEGSNLYYTNARADARVNLQTGANLDLSSKSTSDLSEGSNLYYTDARADARIAAATTTDLTEGSNLYYTTARSDSDTGVYISGDRSYGNITTTGYIRGPSTFYIDPAPVDSDAGLLVIRGDLQVDGTTTTVNSTTVTINDKNIVLADSAANASEADGAGITVNGASATITYDAANDEWDFNKNINVSGNITVSGTVDGRDVATDGTKLDGIEASADVTDATNVAAAGAAMLTGATFTGDVTFTGANYNAVWDASDNALEFGDNAKATFGTSGDLDLYHNGTNSFITNATGTLYIQQAANDADVRIRSDNGSGGYAEYITAEGSTGEVQLFHYGSQKLATKSTGIDVTGEVNADDYVVDLNGVVRFKDTSSVEQAKIGLHSQMRLYMGSTGTNSNAYMRFNGEGSTPIIEPSAAAGATVGTSETIDFGGSSNRWRDIYGKNINVSTDITVGGTVVVGNSNIGSNTSHLAGITINNNGYIGSASATTALQIPTGGGLNVTGAVTADGLTVSTSGTNSEAYFDNGAKSYRLLNRSSDNAFSIFDNTASAFRLTTASNGDISFYEDTGTTAKFFWDASAESLGIGTSSPATISGGIHAVHDATEGTPTAVGDELGIFQRNFNSAQSVAISLISGSASTSNIYFGDNSDIDAGKLSWSNSSNSFSFSGGNVGIGTSSPSVELEIASSAPQMRITDTDTNAVFQINASSTTGGVEIQADATAVGSNPSMAFDVAGSERMRITSAGNVGINEINPSFKLDVEQVGGDAIRINAGADFSGLRLTSTAGEWSLRTSIADAMIFYDVSSASERMRITSAGNVGIGTTNPTRLFSVSSDTTRSTGFEDISEFVTPSIGVGGSVSVNIGRANSTKNLGKVAFYYAGNGSDSNRLGFGFYDADNLMVLQAGGNVGIGTSSPSHLIDARLSGTSSGEVISVGNATNGSFGGIAISDGGTYPVRHWGSSLEFYTGNSTYSSASQAMRIDSNGRVAIGDSGTSANNLTLHNASAVEIDLDCSGGKNFRISSENDSALKFTDKDANTERMRISSAGDVIIFGDLTGLRYFDVYNTASTSTDGAVIRLITEQVGSTATTSADIIKRKNGEFRIANNDTNAAAYIAFNVGSSERMKITSAGNVGIGTDNPIGNFVVSSNGAQGIEFFPNAASGVATTQYYNRSGAAYIRNRNIALDYTFNLSGTTDAVTIASTGNVGIGTGSPSYQLEVRSSSTSKFAVSTDTSNYWYVGQDANGHFSEYIGNTNTNAQARIQQSHNGSTYVSQHLRSHNREIEFTGTSRTRVSINQSPVSSGALLVRSADSGNTGQHGMVLLNDTYSSSTSARRYIDAYHTFTAAGSQVYHYIKTNIHKNSNIMYRAHAIGYNYGTSASINCDVVGYAYAAGSALAGQGGGTISGSASMSAYLSSDNYVVFKVYVGGSGYYAGFRLDVSFDCPTGYQHDFTVLLSTWSTSSTNQYT